MLANPIITLCSSNLPESASFWSITDTLRADMRAEVHVYVIPIFAFGPLEISVMRWETNFPRLAVSTDTAAKSPPGVLDRQIEPVDP